MKSFFVSKTGSLFLPSILAWIKPSLSSANTEEDALITIFVALSIACVWQGNQEMQEGFFTVCDDALELLVWDLFHSKRFCYRNILPVNHFVVLRCILVDRWKWEPSTFFGKCRSGFHYSAEAKLTYVWRVITNHSQENIFRGSKVTVILNHPVNNISLLWLHIPGQI